MNRTRRRVPLCSPNAPADIADYCQKAGYGHPARQSFVTLVSDIHTITLNEIVWIARGRSAIYYTMYKWPAPVQNIATPDGSPLCQAEPVGRVLQPSDRVRQCIGGLIGYHLGYNLLFRWFVGLSLDAVVWDVTVFIQES
jgi:hypothetical protein